MAATERDRQRERTRARILTRARTLFAERGFERTTIRAVAGAAGVDPALVLHYFDTKQDLFTAAVRAAPEPEFDGDPDELADFVLRTLRLKLGGSDHAPMSMLRSMLTHPPATERARDIVDAQGRQLASAIAASNADVRGAVLTSLMLGVRIGREILQLPPLSAASVEEVLDALRPAVRALVEEQP